ncbi:DUF4190 domain-containing protein [Mangrovibacillus cuniculi]|uniref:DUF4190 domain-containing protein n=1 Tax=Mangrovibacillus cuniculi TaxID=2593652 RepID=A0A7S8C9K8_9BACI|nr:DUF4190 domain-containing protein [Mangrovibacillus cuniculi]QPC45899.1 DUF4190 domain-containing protein [Mangrovibacillus cuniculi]
MQNKTNSLSVATLSFSILSLFVPIGGLIFSIVALILAKKAKAQIQQTAERGEGLILAGTIFSYVGLAIQLIILLLSMFGILTYFSVTTG